MTKVIDGQNISLADAISRCGFKRIDDQQFELQDEGKKFVLSNLTGTVREIPVLEDNNENVQAGNSADGIQEIKSERRIRGEDEGGDENPDNIQLAGEPLLQDEDLNKENSRQTKALEQNGFHVIGEDGYQSSSSGGNKNNVNKDSSTSPNIVRGSGQADGSHLENPKDKKSKKS